MQQVNVREMFGAPGVARAEGRPSRPGLPAWLTDWESWLTLALVMLVFLSVARSIDGARWVPGMPSLTYVSFLAILAGFFLAKVRLPEGVLHLAALAIGAPIVYLLTLRFIGAGGLRAGSAEFWDRWTAWLDIVRSGGISSDTMPFVMMVVALAWIAGYLCAWAIFRWHNAWLALVPAGIGLLTNVSYLPGQRSGNFLLFLFGGMLLVMRVHMMRKLREWKRTGTPYPEFLSLTLLNVTTWVALGAMAFAWWAPQANEVPVLARTWERVAGPIGGDSDNFTRLFSGIDAKKEVPLHSFGDTLPLQGKVVLSSRIVAQAEFPEGANPQRAVRAAVYDEYISGGWRAGPRREQDLAADEAAQPTGPQKAQYRDRVPAEVTIVTEQGTPRRTLLGLGVLESFGLPNRAELANAELIVDITAARAKRDLKTGDTYVAKGTTSTASEEKLRAASVDYPQYVRDRYLQLPTSLPQRVREQAASLTRDRRTPFDKAKAIEEYLRTFPTTYDIRSAPPNKDAVDFFLFEEKKGYSDYQASAMVVLLRATGVPARLVTGYQVDEFDLSVRRYLLRERHAYTWAEVYFPGYGWQEFSPYGEAPVVFRPISDGSAGETTPAEDDLIRGINEPGLDELFPEDPGTSVPVTTTQESRWRAFLPVLWVLLGVLAVGAVLAGGVRFAWERGLTGLDYPAQLWEKTIRLATWLRIGPKPSQTPSEYSRQLQRTIPGTEGVERVSRDYLWSRYGGGRELPAAQREELDSAWISLRNRLFKKVFRLK